MKEDKDFGYNPHLHEAISEVVENQIRDGDPKETKETLNRLMNLGYSRHEAIHNIGAVVAEEIYYTLKNCEEFNIKRFVKGLLALK